MTTLEDYQDKKRSGLYEDTTQAQDIIEPVRPEPAPPKPTRVVLPDVAAQTRETVKAIFAEVNDVKSSIKTLRWLVVGAIVLALLALAVAFYSLTNKPTKTVRVEIEKPIYKTKVKKVIVASGGNKWRKKACFTYRDWDACLAYDKDKVPSVARIGR